MLKLNSGFSGSTIISTNNRFSNSDIIFLFYYTIQHNRLQMDPHVPSMGHKDCPGSLMVWELSQGSMSSASCGPSHSCSACYQVLLPPLHRRKAPLYLSCDGALHQNIKKISEAPNINSCILICVLSKWLSNNRITNSFAIQHLLFFCCQQHNGEINEVVGPGKII